MNDGAERTALMGRLHALVSEGLLSESLANRFENAPIEQLRVMVADCDEQVEFYRLCGFEDMSRQEPERAA